MSFPNDFSTLSQGYARFRPAYPKELIEYLASLSSSHHLAWDCGTGNGQAARELGKYFEKVFASDTSISQLASASRKENMHYLLARAESLPALKRIADIVTIAQAIHWFDLDAFYAEVKRVLKPRGIVAAWAYHLGTTDPDIDQTFDVKSHALTV